MALVRRNKTEHSGRYAAVESLRQRIRTLRWGWMYYLTVIFWRYRVFHSDIVVDGIEHVPKEERAMLLVAKHQGYIDPYILWACFDYPIHWLTDQGRFSISKVAKDLYIGSTFRFLREHKMPWLAWAVAWSMALFCVFSDWRSFSIPVDRKKKDKRLNYRALVKMCSVLSKGGVVGIFPEAGVRTKTPVEESAFVDIAKKCKVPILPVNISKGGKRIAFAPLIPCEALEHLTNLDIVSLIERT